jgi:hypothetical protein
VLRKLRSLDDSERHQVRLCLDRLLRTRRWWPVCFSLRVSLMAFTLLLTMPTHPMSIPAALGGALAFNLIPLRLPHWPGRMRDKLIFVSFGR